MPDAHALIRHLIHQAILWYINHVGGAFHTNAYGYDGRYIIAISDAEYRRFKANLTTIRAVELPRDPAEGPWEIEAPNNA